MAPPLRGRDGVNLLVFNCGSSSLGFKMYKTDGQEISEVLLTGKAHRVGVQGTEPSSIEYVRSGKTETASVPLENHRRAAWHILRRIEENGPAPDAVGHRFVHGGRYFKGAALIDDGTLPTLKQCLPLAPLHNPISLSVISECRRTIPRVPQYVAFDSAFHSSIPAYAYQYLVPRALAEKFDFRKYGFHGLSYSYVVQEAARFLGRPVEQLRLVACHLGTGGSSVAAIRAGRSVDTSMGFSPLMGLMMSTRSGDIEPMIALYLLAAYGIRPDALLDFLNKKSGLLGISGISSDIRDILAHTSDMNAGEHSELAFAMYIHRLKRYVGSYVAVLEGMDALVFTDDIGYTNWRVREELCRSLRWCGVDLDLELNHHTEQAGIHSLNRAGSRVSILAIPTDEELVIARAGLPLLGQRHV